MKKKKALIKIIHFNLVLYKMLIQKRYVVNLTSADRDIQRYFVLRRLDGVVKSEQK